MTVLVGLLCKEGVVIGADSSATFGPHPQIKTIEQKVPKIFIVQNRFVIAGTGSIGAFQRFVDAVECGWKQQKFIKAETPVQFGKIFSSVGQSDFVETGAQKGCLGALVGFSARGTISLCELAAADFQPEIKTDKMWFASMGSGQVITDPFLGMMSRIFFKESRPTLKEGLFLATWTLMHAIGLNPGGIDGPPQLATITASPKSGDLNPVARIVEDDELEEHKNSVDAAEAHLSKYRDLLGSGGSSSAPSIPV